MGGRRSSGNRDKKAVMFQMPATSKEKPFTFMGI
jgi:hypothetical protein